MCNFFCIKVFEKLLKSSRHKVDKEKSPKLTKICNFLHWSDRKTRQIIWLSISTSKEFKILFFKKWKNVNISHIHAPSKIDVYQANVSTNRTTKTYYGLAGTTFKKRYGGRRSNLENREDYGTALSKYLWLLRDNNVTFDLKWSIKKKAQVYSAGAKYCDLCLTEKAIIMLADKNCINIRSEILQKCPHIKKFTLVMVKP